MLRRFLPYAINKNLFGDRKKYGTKVVEDDEEWVKFCNYSKILSIL